MRVFMREPISERMPESIRVIYDFGANNGDDVPYYLKKAERVVAVEANPALCREMEERFSAEIHEGRLRIENCVVLGEGSAARVRFYLHKRHHVLGQFPEPDASVRGSYEEVLLPARPVMEILREHGEPYFVKIDLEGADAAILRAILRQGVRPAYVSAELQSIQVFALLAGLGEYGAFKLVDGATVAQRYGQHMIEVNGRREIYSFRAHSAGPFGDDVAGEWMNADDLFALLAKEKLGWKDIHATRLAEPEGTSQAQKQRYRSRHFMGWVRKHLLGEDKLE
jgi:FkbM family methyltransferase